MCGILFCICESNHNLISFDCEELNTLSYRGPDAKCIIKTNTYYAAGFVLWHQGDAITQQPIETSSHLLLFNGDIFNLEDYVDEQTKHSDSHWLFEKLSLAKNDKEIMDLFRHIEGPFSFIFYNKLQKVVYFGRDSLGRNSLIIEMENNKKHLRILSTSLLSFNKQWKSIEVPPLGIYKMQQDRILDFTVFPWKTAYGNSLIEAKQFEDLRNMEIKINIESNLDPVWLNIEPTMRYSFSFYDVKKEYSSTCSLYDYFLDNMEITKALDDFALHLEKSVQKRVQTTRNVCKNCIQNDASSPCSHSKIAILFSGGIDCTILSILSDKFVDKSDSIDLINVSFEAVNKNVNMWDVPDRISAKTSYETLKQLCPERQWNFIEVNVSRAELYEKLTTHIKNLIYPLDTILDESIGCAFWFASRGFGLLNTQQWESSARVVIVGSGADELFGGYIRHRNAYRRCNGSEEEKQECVLAELENDWKRIPSRNLGRDDRVISDNGKTPRAPFIEENVCKFVRSLKSSQRCCFIYDEGVGDKLFLRLYGYRLGLTNSAFLKKRAIQFGSRIANKKENASDRSMYLTIE